MSVILLCYNQAPFVVSALDSIRNQSHRNIQLIVADDKSTDDSVRVIQRWQKESGYPLHFISHVENVGICRTLNEAVRVANGDYVAIVAADDYWFPEKLERQLEVFKRSGSDVGVVYSDAWRENTDGQRLSGTFIEHVRRFDRAPEGDLLGVLLDGNFIPALTPLIRRSCYDRVGVYDERLAYEDYDMWLRLAASFKFAFLQWPSGVYRIVPTSATKVLLHDKASFRPRLDSFTIYESCLATSRGRREFREALATKMQRLAEQLYAKKYARVSEVLWRAMRARCRPRLMMLFVLARLRVPYGGVERIDGILAAFSRGARPTSE